MRWLLVLLLLPGCTSPVDVGCGGGDWTGNAPPVGAFATDVDAVASLLAADFDAIDVYPTYLELRNNESRLLLKDGLQGIMLQLESYATYPGAGVAETGHEVQRWFDVLRIQVSVVETFQNSPLHRGWYQEWDGTILDSTAGLLTSRPNGTASLQFGALRELPASATLLDATSAVATYQACSSWHSSELMGMSVINDSLAYVVVALDECDTLRHFYMDAVTGAVDFEDPPCSDE